jgi:uncharacterized protein (DUF849 family)
VIHCINLAVDEGAFTVFVTPSGCGNAQLVERARTIIEAMGASISSPQKAREMLRLCSR